MDWRRLPRSQRRGGFHSIPGVSGFGSSAFLAVLTVFSFHRILSQELTIAGVVTEKVSGEVIIGVNVLIYQDTSESPRGAPLRGSGTNKFGFYSIPKVS